MTNFKLTKSSTKSNPNLKHSTLANNGSGAFTASNQKKFNDFNNNEQAVNELNHIEPEFIDVKIVFPNGKSYDQTISTKKAIYDLLIELSASARLIPTNYSLKLFGDRNDKNEYESIIDYTPNQKIGQLNPAKIKIVPKTATLKHQQLQLFPADAPKKPDLLPASTNDLNKSSTIPANHADGNKYSKSTSLGANWIITSKQAALQSQVSIQQQQQQPFELTICVQVNLPFNQKTIVRVKKEILLEDLFTLICREAKLEKNKYEFYIPNIQEPYTMQESFANFDTKEVCLILKKHLKETSGNADNRYQSQLYAQNNSKSRGNPKIYQANRIAKEVLQRSKSDIDLSFSNKSPVSEEDESSFDANSSFNSNTDSKTMKKIFGNTTNKKSQLSKSRGSLNTYECSDGSNNGTNLKTSSLNDSKLSLNSSKSGDSRSKKRLAPAPPSAVHESLHHIALQNIMTKKKGKAPAPPPPASQPTEKTLNIETKPTGMAIATVDITTNISSSVSSPSGGSSSLSSPLSSLSSQSSDQNDSSQNKGIARIITNSLIIPATDLPKPEDISDRVQAASSPLPQRSEIYDSSKIEVKYNVNGIIKRSDSIQSINSDIDVSLNHMENSMMSAGSDAQTDNLRKEQKEKFENFVHIDGILRDSNNNNSTAHEDTNYFLDKSLNGVKSCNGAVIGQKSFSEDDYSDMEILNSPKPIYNSIDHSIAASITSSLYNLDPINKIMKSEPAEHKAFNSQQSFNISDQTIQDKTINKNSQESLSNSYEENQILMNHPQKMTSIIEVRPVYSTSNLIQAPFENEIKNAETKNGSSSSVSLKSNEYEDQELKSINNLSPNIKQNKSSTLPVGSKLGCNLNLRSPMSPPPQFPAIAEKDLNEQHQNYTVVRSGEIIEKNGTYYSTDGTVRGYSGTVRKIANSKTLNEIFEKHKELEQLHEREYEQELQEKLQKQLNLEASKNNQEKKTVANFNQPNKPSESKNNLRTSLGSIIANEKRSTLPASLKNNANLYAPKPFVKQHIPDKSLSKVDSELSKKLENRRQSIMAAQIKQEEKLQTQRALHKRLHMETQQAPVYETKCEIINLQIDVKSANSLSDSTSNSTMSSSSSESSKNNSNVSPSDFPRVQVPPPAPPIISNLMVEKNLTDSSSSLSLSTHSSDSSTANTINRRNIKPLTAKNVPNNKAANLDNRVSILLDELKSVVPLIDENSNYIKVTSNAAPTQTSNSYTDKLKVGPSTAPKNFNKQTLKTINQKNQIVDTRENLLESIKGFSINSLRRVSTEPV